MGKSLVKKVTSTNTLYKFDSLSLDVSKIVYLILFINILINLSEIIVIIRNIIFGLKFITLDIADTVTTRFNL